MAWLLRVSSSVQNSQNSSGLGLLGANKIVTAIFQKHCKESGLCACQTRISSQFLSMFS
jgi:hypothetical protein